MYQVFSKTGWILNELASVRCDAIPIPGCGIFERAALGSVIDVDQSEALFVAFRPFEVV